MGKQTHLCRRKGSRNYYFRCRIPTDVLPYFAPKKEIIRSLGTTDRTEALSRLRLEALKQDQAFAEARRRLAQEVATELSDTEVERLAALYLHYILDEDETSRQEGLGGDEVFAAVRKQVEAAGGATFWSEDDLKREGGGLTGREYKQIEENVNYVLPVLKADYARGKISHVEDNVEELLDAEGIRLDKTSTSYQRLARAILKANIRGLELIASRHKGEVVDTPPAPPPTQSSPYPTKDGDLTLSMVFEKWKAERQPSAKTASDFGAHIRRFTELHGDLLLSTITKAHVREYKDAMLRLPSRPPKSRQGVTVKELLKMTEADPTIPRLTAKTVNEKALGALNAIFNWAVANGYIDDNPATRIRVATGKTSRTTRLPYSTEDLNLIFKFPIFTEEERPKAGGGEAAKWLPLMALFTGARLEELGQLLVADVKEELGVLYLDMMTIEEGKGYKNQSSRRKVPIHSELVRLGLMDYVAECRQAGVTQLFPSLRAEGDKMTAAWSKWWGRYARVHGITDTRKVFHSFRHTVKDGFRNNGVAGELADAIQGHSPKNVGGTYGIGYALPVLAEALERLRFPGVELSIIRNGMTPLPSPIS